MGYPREREVIMYSEHTASLYIVDYILNLTTPPLPLYFYPIFIVHMPVIIYKGGEEQSYPVLCSSQQPSTATNKPYPDAHPQHRLFPSTSTNTTVSLPLHLILPRHELEIRHGEKTPLIIPIFYLERGEGGGEIR